MRATLDPVATAKIEESMLAPEESHTIVIVKNMQQAAYVSDCTGYFRGTIVEYGERRQVLEDPSQKRTGKSTTGRLW